MMRASFIQLGIAALVLSASVGLVITGSLLIEKEQRHAAQAREEFTQKQTEALKVAAAKEALPALATDEAAINTYFVKPDDIVPFLESLQAIGRARGARVDVVSVDGNQNNPQKRITVSLKITGSFEGVMRTLGSIEYSPHDIALSSLTLDTDLGTEGKSTGVWTGAAIFSIGTQAVTMPQPKK